MNLDAYNFRLLFVFDAVMRERSVTRAGSHIGLSQSAMSHALNRLRSMLGDELFIRTPEGMIPTPRAEELAQPLHNALNELRLILEPAAFDPASSDRRFVLVVDNYAAVVFTPPLVAAVSAAAPAIRVDLQPWGTLDIADSLSRGSLDLAIATIDSPGERFAMAPLLEDAFVLVMRRGHPASRRRLSAAAFAALPHLEISSKLMDIGYIDRWLTKRSLARRIVMRAPYLSAAAILAGSDLVTILRRQNAREFVRNHPLEIHESGHNWPRVPLTMLWHRRLDRQPAHRWLRDIIQSVAKTL